MFRISKHLPTIAGYQAFGPEHEGGPYRYLDILRVAGAAPAELRTDDHELKRWLGPKLDPEHFDLVTTKAAVWNALRKPRRWQR